jgi:hypothetical protein
MRATTPLNEGAEEDETDDDTEEAEDDEDAPRSVSAYANMYFKSALICKC